MPKQTSPESLERILAAKTSADLNTEVTKVLEGLLAGTITPAEGQALTEAAKSVLQVQLARINYATARGAEPTLSFFEWSQRKSAGPRK